MPQQSFIGHCKRIQKALLYAGISTRKQLVQGYDAHSDYTDIKHIGPMLGDVLHECIEGYGQREWETAFPGIAWE